jgi:aminoglycoside phosphotransferase (APT) family kinase protein
MVHRDDAQIAGRFVAWARDAFPSWPHLALDALDRPAAGWSNETLLLTLSFDGEQGRRRERLVVRMPTLVPSFPVYDLAAQARVLDALADAGVPTATTVAVEPDARVLGAPFLVMSFVEGRPGPEAPGADPWLVDAPLPVQRAVHERFLAALAAVHRVDWAADDLPRALRGGGPGTLEREVQWWVDYVDWASDGAPPSRLAAAATWCRDHVPSTPIAPVAPSLSLCWGDARLGNVMFDDDRNVVALLDWELASIAPAECDLAWYLVLDRLTSKFTGAVPGFLPRDDAIAYYEQRLGRGVVDLDWHEIFALVRSSAINDRQARMAAAAGVEYPGVAGDDNPVLRYVEHRIERYGSTA